jgi:hypothetical protein
MSYIRSTSNPEGLYIWSDGPTVTICVAHDYTLHNLEDNQIVIATKDFKSAIRCFKKRGKNHS